MKTSLSAQYMAGLYDGEGYGSLTFIKQRHGHGREYVNILIGLCIDKRYREQVIDYLSKHGIRTTTFEQKNALGRSCHLRIRTADIEAFIRMIIPYVLFKKTRLGLLLKGLQLKKTVSWNPQETAKNLYTFDDLRHKIHALSVKGPRKIKDAKYYFPQYFGNTSLNKSIRKREYQ